MNVPCWLLRLLPMWSYICPKCRKEVKQNSHECPHCGEKYPSAIRVPPTFLKDPKKLEAYVHKHVIPRVSEFERNYLTKYFTVLFADGFESGDFTAWTGTSISAGCTCEVENLHPHHGTYNARVLVTGASVNAYGYKTIASTTIAYARGYVKFNQLNITNGQSLPVLVLDNGNWQYGVYAAVYNNGGTLRWQLRSFDAVTGTVNTLGTHTPVTGVWYCVEIKRDVTNDLQELFIDNVSEASGTAVIINNSSRVIAGVQYQPQNDTNELYLDCVVAADAYIGPESSYSPSTRSSLPNTMMTMLNSKMLFS